MYRFITANNTVVRIFDSGAGSPEQAQRPTIVLLHGYLEAIEVWEQFIELLEPHLRVIAIDLPGHGFSPVAAEVHTMEYLATTVAQSLSMLGIERYVVLGHSMGGYVALEMLDKYPQAISAIILMHSTPNIDSPEKSAQREREVEIILSAKGDLLTSSTIDRFAKANQSKFDELIEELSELALLTDKQGMIALLRGMQRRKEHNKTLQKSSVAQLMIFGEDDSFLPIEVAREVAKNHPQAHSVWLDSSGHLGFLEQPEQSLTSILEFLQSKEIL